MREFLQHLASGQSFSEEEMREAVTKLFSPDTTESEIAAFLLALHMKGETVDEIVGLVECLREKALPFQPTTSHIMDNCGTGGDGSSSFNISTTSAFVIAGAGVPVAKHGNRSISSKTGSADVLEQLGVPLYLSPEATTQCIEEVGISFLFAQHVHPHMGKIMKVRKDLKIPTIFNLIGPLTNPIPLEYQLVGTFRKNMLSSYAQVLKKLGRKRAVVVSGAGQMDEASLQGVNHLMIVDNGRIFEQKLTAADVQLSVFSNEEIRGGGPLENARILLEVLNGKQGACRDTVLLNAGIAIYAGNQAQTILEGIAKAKDSIDSGAALNKLEALISFGQKVQKEVV